jgi:hypothetical protein
VAAGPASAAAPVGHWAVPIEARPGWAASAARRNSGAHSLPRGTPGRKLAASSAHGRKSAGHIPPDFSRRRSGAGRRPRESRRRPLPAGCGALPCAYGEFLQGCAARSPGKGGSGGACPANRDSDRWNPAGAVASRPDRIGARGDGSQVSGRDLSTSHAARKGQILRMGRLHNLQREVTKLQTTSYGGPRFR